MLPSVPAPLLGQVSLIATQHRSSPAPVPSPVSVGSVCSLLVLLEKQQLPSQQTLCLVFPYRSRYSCPSSCPFGQFPAIRSEAYDCSPPHGFFGAALWQPHPEERMPFPHTQLVLWPHGVRTRGHGSRGGPAGSPSYGVTCSQMERHSFWCQVGFWVTAMGSDGMVGSDGVAWSYSRVLWSG